MRVVYTNVYVSLDVCLVHVTSQFDLTQQHDICICACFFHESPVCTRACIPFQAEMFLANVQIGSTPGTKVATVIVRDKLEAPPPREEVKGSYDHLSIDCVEPLLCVVLCDLGGLIPQ